MFYYFEKFKTLSTYHTWSDTDIMDRQKEPSRTYVQFMTMYIYAKKFIFKLAV